MKKFNADTQENILEPIEITLEGKVYVVEKVTTDMITKITAGGAEDGEPGIEDVVSQTSILLGADETELRNVDIRKLSSVLSYLTTTITEQIQNPKNSEGDEASPSA